MKKALLTIIAFGTFLPLSAYAAPFLPAVGGTGISTPPSYGQILVGNSSGTYTLTATSSLGLGNAASSTLLSDSNTWSGANTFGNITINGTCTGSGCGSTFSYPWTPASNYAAVNSATTSIIWAQLGINASSTSHFVYASTTAISGTSVCIGTDCRTSWPTASGSSFSYPFTPASNYGTTNSATTSVLWAQSGLNASSTSHFAYASTTAISGTSFCIGDDCRTSWPTGAAGSYTFATTTREVVNSAALAALASAQQVVYRHTDGSFQLAKADAAATAAAVAVVESVSGNNVTLVYGGEIALTGATDGQQLYLSAATAGAMTSISPTATTTYVVPILTTTGATSGIVEIGEPISLAPLYNSDMEYMPAHTFKGNNSASPSAPDDLTAAELTAELVAVVGDSGSGGTKGLVPAPASGDAAASKYLKADGTWATVSVGASASSTLLADTNTWSGANTFGNITINGTCTGSGCGGGSSFAYPWTPLSNYATLNSATTSIIWAQLGINASSTSHFVYASTTAISGASICIGTDCRSEWPTVAGSATTTLLADTNTWSGTNTFGDVVINGSCTGSGCGGGGSTAQSQQVSLSSCSPEATSTRFTVGGAWAQPSIISDTSQFFPSSLNLASAMSSAWSCIVHVPANYVSGLTLVTVYTATGTSGVAYVDIDAADVNPQGGNYDAIVWDEIWPASTTAAYRIAIPSTAGVATTTAVSLAGVTSLAAGHDVVLRYTRWGASDTLGADLRIINHYINFTGN